MGRGRKRLPKLTEFFLQVEGVMDRGGTGGTEEPGQAWAVWGAPAPPHEHSLRDAGAERGAINLFQILYFLPVHTHLWGYLPSFYRKQNMFSHT